jgi:hypothetical protein
VTLCQQSDSGEVVPVSALLRAAADDREAVERERDEWRKRAEDAEARQQDVARTMYRRGYLAGRASQRRGDPAVTNPERHARGEARRLLA